MNWLKTFLKGKKDCLDSWQCVGNGQWHHLFCQANLLSQCTAFSALLLCLTFTSSPLKCCLAHWFIQWWVYSLCPLCLSMWRWWKHHSSGECCAVPSPAFLLTSWSLFFFNYISMETFIIDKNFKVIKLWGMDIACMYESLVFYR